MKKAKIILTAIAVFAVVGGALAFKTARFTEIQLWTITGTGTTSTTLTTAVGGPTFTYVATYPSCATVDLFASPTAPIQVTPRFTAALNVVATAIGGNPLTATTTIGYIGCPTFPTTKVQFAIP